MSDSSYNNVLIYLEKNESEFYNIMYALRYTCGKTYNYKTIIIPPKDAITSMKDLIKKEKYLQATNILRTFFLTSLFLKGSDFTKNEPVNWYLRPIKIKSVKDDETVEIESGTLTFVNSYNNLSPKIGEEYSITALWRLKGIIVPQDPIDPEKKKKKTKGGCDTSIVNPLQFPINTFFIKLSRDDSIYKYFNMVVNSFSLAQRNSLIFLSTGYVELDILTLFCFNKVFPYSMIVDSIKKNLNCNKINNNDSNYNFYSTYISNNNTIEEHKKNLTSIISTYLYSNNTVNPKHLLLDIIQNICDYNHIKHYESGNILCKNILPEYLFEIFKENPKAYFRYIEIKTLFLKALEADKDPLFVIQLFCNIYKDFGGIKDEKVYSFFDDCCKSERISTEDHKGTMENIFYKYSIENIFTSIDPKYRSFPPVYRTSYK